MGREIKFRTWDKQLKKMDTSPKFATQDMSLNGTFTIFGASFEFMQFTGLTDKAGVEIYEGDIVEWTIWPEDFNRAAPIEKRIRDVVVFGRSGSWVAKERHEILGLKEPFRELQVIGNIYENPDLASPQTKEEK